MTRTFANRKWLLYVLWLGGLGAFSGCSPASHAAPPSATQSPSQDSKPAAAQPPTGATIGAFLKTHCYRCHGAEVQEADLNLEQLAVDFSGPLSAQTWLEVRNRLHKGTMPPKDEPQPALSELETVVTWIDRQLQAAAARSTPPRVVLRRLNRAEYNNTIRDLVGLNFRPADSFPEDPPGHGFDNVGAALTLSPLQIEQYLQAAREIFNRAIVVGERPPTLRWDFNLQQVYERGEGELHDYPLRQAGVTYGSITLWRNARRDQFAVLRRDSWDTHIVVRLLPAAFTGEYVVRVRAASVIPDRETVHQVGIAKNEQKLAEELAQAKDADERQRTIDRWDRWIWPDVRQHFEQDMMYDYGPPRMRLLDNQKSILGEVDVAATATEPEVYEFRFWLEQGDQTLTLYNSYNIPEVLENHWMQKHPDFPRPELLIESISIEGPVFDNWPPQSHQRLLAGTEALSSDLERARLVLRRFMPRAFRRPVEPAEIDAMLTLFQQTRGSHSSFATAIQVPLAAVLTSPHFLYLVEPSDDETSTRRLNDFELASRLSYFLWSSMPDDELFVLASQAKLHDPAVLRAQIDRMLADPKSVALVKNFAGQWLGLRQVGANPPVRGLFPHYDDHLEKSLVGESEAFFAEILQHDLSVLNFIKSDFVVINERLARHYEISGVKGDHFRRVAVPPDVHRGGLLTQASMLTITSNGTRTSPVNRGVWVLQNLLGDPPAPPPPDVGDIAPQVPGIDKATVRVRLQAHLQIAQCASCHRKIDPLGFALENFHADGRWRDQEGFGYNGRVNADDPPIDASGQLPDGRTFQSFAELQTLLLEDQDPFLRCLSEKLTIYALGRGLTFGDHAHVEQFVQNLKNNSSTLRSLIHDIVTSELFLTK